MVPAGAVIRAVGRPWRPVLEVPAAAFRRHMVIVGASGSGKTNLMIRLWAGWMAATLAAARRGKPRPLLVALDCKGGPDARAKADRTRRVLRGTGAGRVAIWPDDATLNLWALPPGTLAVLLHQMIEHGDGAAAYYADITQAVLTLAVTAPPGPPRSAARVPRPAGPRLAGRRLVGRDARTSSPPWPPPAPTPGDIQLRYSTLLGRLGPALDGPGHLADADAWYLILEGTSEPSVAEAQAMAVTELVAHAATSRGTEPREILFAADDYSAVSPPGAAVEPVRARPVPRTRRHGLRPVLAGTGQGRGRAVPDRRHRRRRRLGHADPLPRAAVQARRHPPRPGIGAQAARAPRGATREPAACSPPGPPTPTSSASRTPGQACYIRRGSAVFAQIARPRPVPLPLPAAAARPASSPRRRAGPRPARPGTGPADAAPARRPRRRRRPRRARLTTCSAPPPVEDREPVRRPAPARQPRA